MPTRLTPYELILEPLAAAFPAIQEEADARRVDPRRRDQFLLLSEVGAALGELTPSEAPAEAIDEYGELLYQGFEFWSFGKRLYALHEDVATRLTTPTYDLGDWILAAPPACYLQFPYQRFWGRVDSEAPYEPVDGIFAVVDETAPAPEAGAHLRAQLVLGLRPDRPGVSLVSYRTDLDPRAPGREAGRPWRAEGEPFANAIPGGERKGYRTLATTSELESLLIRTFHYLDTHPAKLIAHPGSATSGERTSALPYVEVR